MNVWYERVVEPLVNDMNQIEKCKEKMSDDEKKELSTILNVEKGKSRNELEKDKERLEMELLFVNYGLKLREKYPAMKSLKLMKSVIPEDNIGEGINVEVTNSQIVNDSFEPSDDEKEVFHPPPPLPVHYTDEKEDKKEDDARNSFFNF